jgi:hypothetical protein
MADVVASEEKQQRLSHRDQAVTYGIQALSRPYPPNWRI